MLVVGVLRQAFGALDYVDALGGYTWLYVGSAGVGLGAFLIAHSGVGVEFHPSHAAALEG